MNSLSVIDAISVVGSFASIYSVVFAHQNASSYEKKRTPTWPFSFAPLLVYLFLILIGYLPTNEETIVFSYAISSSSHIQITFGLVFVFSSMACLYADMIMAWAYSRKLKVNRNFNMFIKSLICLVVAVLAFNLVPWVGSSSVFILLALSMLLSCLLWYQAPRGANKVHHTPEALGIIAIVLIVAVPFINNNLL